MQKSGAFLTTFEGVIFEILRDSTNPYFKKILPILKQKL
jgi:hypothetical protein